MAASGFFVSRASHGKAGALSMAGCSRRAAEQQFFESHPGRCNGLSNDICVVRGERLRGTLRRRAEGARLARASGADLRVSMQGGNMRSSLWQKHRMRRSAAFALRRKTSSTSRPSGVLLLSYPRASLRIVPFRLPAPSTSRVSDAIFPPPPQRPRLRFKVFRAPDFVL